MAVHLYTHPACLGHHTPAGHPERVQRLETVLARLEEAPFDTLVRHEARLASEDELLRIHSPAHVDLVRRVAPDKGYAMIDGDTMMSPGSWEAGLRAAGALCEAVDMVVANEGHRAFCAVRPPGHHAEPDRAMGFCLFNNVAIGAAHARAVHDVERVAIVDFDVHHGNGTQAAFEAEPRVLFCSTHQMPLYPGTGRRSETGVGNIVNAPLAPGSGGAEFRHALVEFVFPAIEDFRPDLLMISAGFDAHAADPLAGLDLVEDDFAWATGQLVRIADRHCAGRIVSTLEGGYDLDALVRSVAVHVAELMDPSATLVADRPSR